MNGSQVVPLHLDEAFANPKLLERLGRQDERWIAVVPRGWRAQDEMTPSQSGSRRAGYDSALADQANSARLCSSGGQGLPDGRGRRGVACLLDSI